MAEQRNRKVDEQLLWHNAMAFLDGAETGTRCLACIEVEFGDGHQIAEASQKLLQKLLLEGVKVGKLEVAVVVQSRIRDWAANAWERLSPSLHSFFSRLIAEQTFGRPSTEHS